MAARDPGQHDGITQGLELVSERWALLIVRDLLADLGTHGRARRDSNPQPSNP
jgi:DNA-binding HxlR family transcriptional regulator